MNTQATAIQVEQANDISFINELHSAAIETVQDYIEDSIEADNLFYNALDVIELIEDGKYLEAVMVGMNF